MNNKNNQKLVFEPDFFLKELFYLSHLLMKIYLSFL